VRHPDFSTVWRSVRVQDDLNGDGRVQLRCVDSPKAQACIHTVGLAVRCEQCPLDWRDYATNNGGL
jgi:hypothetical protein